MYVCMYACILNCRVHSPIDISDLKRSAERFPEAKEIRFMDCVVKSGQAIFIPSFYWHEVTSSPSQAMPFSSPSSVGPSVADKNQCDHGSSCNNIQGEYSEISYNLAVNHWFAPLYDKEFPCATCRKKLNPAYRKQLETLFHNKMLTRN